MVQGTAEKQMRAPLLRPAGQLRTLQLTVETTVETEGGQ